MTLLQALVFISAIVIAFLVISICYKIARRKKLRKEAESPMVWICRCPECGYVGRISHVCNGEQFGPFVGELFYCPKCDSGLWTRTNVYSVPRNEAAAKIAELKAEYAQDTAQPAVSELKNKCPHCGGDVTQVVNDAFRREDLKFEREFARGFNRQEDAKMFLKYKWWWIGYIAIITLIITATIYCALR